MIKQINLLEADLGVELFEHTHCGLRLTKAGTSLYNDAKYIIQYCRDSVIRAKNAMRDDIGQNHSQIHIVDFDFYSVEIFNRCENSNDVLMAVRAWENVHPLLKVIPVDWNHAIPYGLLHSPTNSKTVNQFLTAIQTVLHSS